MNHWNRSSLGGGRDGPSVTLVRQTSDRWRLVLNEPQLKLSESNEHIFQSFPHGNRIKLHFATHGPENKMHDSNAIPKDEFSTWYINAFKEFSTLRRQGNQRCVSCFSARNRKLQTTLAMMHARIRLSFSSYLRGLRQYYLPFRKYHLRVGRKRNKSFFSARPS